MRFSVVVLCFFAVSVHMAVALQQAEQPLVVVGDLATEERGKQPTLDVDDFEEVPAVPHQQGAHNDFGDDNNNGEWHEPNRHCPRKWPLAQRGPTQVSYEFEHHKVAPDLIEQAPTLYVEVR
jgi:hypothetical protein